MQNIVLKPVFSVEQANRRASEGGFRGLYLRPQHYDRCLRDSAVGVLEGEKKFVFLKNVLAPEGVALASRTLARLKYGRGRRLQQTLRSTWGEDMVMGYLPRPARMTEPTRRYSRAYFTVGVPLCWVFQQLLTEYWPEAVSHVPEHDPMRIGVELRAFSAVGPPPHFSALTLNRNLICSSHKDGSNVGPACLTVFGRWVGAALCFPRLRVAFDLKPGDVLIADTREEQHGNVGPLAGTRISVIAYRRRITDPIISSAV